MANRACETSKSLDMVIMHRFWHGIPGSTGKPDELVADDFSSQGLQLCRRSHEFVAPCRFEA